MKLFLLCPGDSPPFRDYAFRWIGWGLMIFAAIFLLTGCSSSSYTWGWYVVLPFTEQGVTNLRFLIGGLGLTVLLSVIGITFSVILGLFIGIVGLSKNRALRWFNRVYVESLRSIPPLVLILWVYY